MSNDNQFKTKSEAFLESKDYRNTLSPLSFKSVSSARRDLLNQEFDHGLFKDGSYSKQNSDVVHSQSVLPGIVKSAQMLSSTSSIGGGYKGSNNTVRQGPDIYSPLWLNSNMSLPRDRATVNAWCRAFYTLNPIIHNSINLHSTYPISKLNIKCEDPSIENFFNEMIEETDLMNICIMMAQEYWLLGEVFIYGDFDASRATWSNFVIQNPDFMISKRTFTKEPLIMMRPDEHLKRLVGSNKPSDIAQRKNLPPHMLESIRRGKNIVFENFNASHIVRKTSAYESRGTGLPVSVFRQLMLIDQIRECKYVQYQDMVNPMRIIKIGNESFRPSPEHLEAYRNAFEEATYDKSYKLFTHDGVTVETVGAGSGIYDTNADLTQLIKEVYIGMMIPSVIIEGGGDITYQNGQVSLDVLRQRYMSFRNILAAWLKKKVFAPISELRGFTVGKEGHKKLIVPEIEWNHMSLFDTGDYITNLVSLTQGEGDKRRASIHTLYRSLGLEYEDEMRKIRAENVREAIITKEKALLQEMSLAELRAINDDTEINEKADAEGGGGASVPGEAPPPPPPPPPGMPPM